MDRSIGNTLSFVRLFLLGGFLANADLLELTSMLSSLLQNSLSWSLGSIPHYISQRVTLNLLIFFLTNLIIEGGGLGLESFPVLFLRIWQSLALSARLNFCNSYQRNNGQTYEYNFLSPL